MGDATVTLEFGEHLVTVPCEQAQVATDADDVAVATPEAANDVPPGYVRIVEATGFDPGGGYAGTLPEIGDGSTILVSDEHVAMIQREA